MRRKSARWLAAALALVLLGSGGYILWKNVDYGKGEQDYQEALKTAGIPQWVQPGERSEPTTAPQETAAPQEDPYAAALANADLDALREVNGDVIAWISIPGTRLSYPVLQGEDNSYYLNHTWLKQRSSVGSIYMECQCAPDFSDFNTILYGHRMNNTSMFGVLKRYESLDFCQSHPCVYITTDSGVAVYDVFAAFEVGVSEIVYRLNVDESGLEEDFFAFCRTHSEVDTGIAPQTGDRVLTLSTCTGQGHDTRWVVLAVLRAPDEPDAPEAPSPGEAPLPAESETPAETAPLPAQSEPPA